MISIFGNRRAALLIRFRRPISIVVHVMLVIASAWIAAWLRFDGDIPDEYVSYFLKTLPLLIACRLIVFVPFRLFQGVWRYTSIHDLRNIVGGVVISSALFYALHPAFPLQRAFPRSILLMDSNILVCLMAGIRLSRRIYRDMVQEPHGRRVIIFGAGDAGELIARDMRQNPQYHAQPIGFIDDNRARVGQRIHGIPVLGTRQDVRWILEQQKPDEVLIAVPSASAETLRGIVRSLEQSKVRLTTLSGREHFIGRPVNVDQIRPLEVQDLLRREPVTLDPASLQSLFAGRRVLVTGAGGSIGSEICRQVAAFQPLRLVALDRYENSLFDLLNTLNTAQPGLGLAGVIADVTDEQRMEAVFAEHAPDIVFHAAAHKHVPLMEANPCEAVKNNVRGTRITAQAAQRHGCGRFILVSTDKAVNPTSVMGATKRVAELLTHELGERRGTTNFSTVRFGNVLASNGSVVPVFLEQIKRGGPVTVTHPDMQRYFMLISEAVQLVLQAATLPERGCAYVLEMGEQIKLLDMARDLIRLAGYIPDEEVPITFTGPRPGEKLSEQLVGDDERAESAPVSQIRRLRTTTPHPLSGQLLAAIQQLEAAAAAGDSALMIEELCRLVPTFTPQVAAGSRVSVA